MGGVSSRLGVASESVLCSRQVACLQINDGLEVEKHSPLAEGFAQVIFEEGGVFCPLRQSRGEEANPGPAAAELRLVSWRVLRGAEVRGLYPHRRESVVNLGSRSVR